MPVMIRNASLVLILLMACHFSLAQDALLTRTLTLHMDSVRVRAFVDTLAARLGVGLSYDADALPLDSVVTVNWNQTGVRNGLYDMFGRDRIEVASLPNLIVIGKAQYVGKAEVQAHIVLSGSVRDLSTNEPLPAVNICLANSALGTITNNEGEFLFRLPAAMVGHEVYFSIVGYAASSLTVPMSDSVCGVLMVSTQYNLPEVRVQSISADAVIAGVLAKRDENYLQSTVALTGFFRETVQQNNRYVQASEAVVEIYKPPYAENLKTEKVKFIKGRKNHHLERPNAVQLRLQGGPYYFSRLDVMRYLDFLPNQQSDPLYKYRYAGTQWLNNQALVRIAFEPITDDGELLYRGEFLVDDQSFAVVRVQFEMTPKTLRESRKYLIKKESRHYKALPYYATYVVDYRFFKGRWILNSVKGDVKIRVKDKQHKIDADFYATTEMLIVDLRPIDGEKLKYSETFKPDYVLADKIKGDDADFWRNFNIIKPNEELEKVFKVPPMK
jgi:hypothetical protein